jgi:hypothetical protein
VAKWLQRRDRKESLRCDACGKYYMRAQFYDWYTRPELSFIDRKCYGVMCTKCAKREIGSKYLNEL